MTFVFSTKPYQLLILEPRIWNSISYRYHATLIPTLSCLMSIHTKLIISLSCIISYNFHAKIVPTHYSQYLNSSHTITNQVKKQSHNALPRPAPRSGRRISLRRDVLAQASPLHLGEGSKGHQENHAGSRLG